MKFDTSCTSAIQYIYELFYEPSGNLKISSFSLNDIYQTLISDSSPNSQNYFNHISREIQNNVANKLKFNPPVLWNSQQYYFINSTSYKPCNSLAVRIIANIPTQEDAIFVAIELSDILADPHNSLCNMIECFKVLLGSSMQKPVKKDKIVIYIHVPISSSPTRILPYITILLDFLSIYASEITAETGQPMNPFANQLPYADVAYGEGLDYRNQRMAFTEPRADAVFDVLTANPSCDFNQFNSELASAFNKKNLSTKLLFANKGSENFIWT